MGKHDYDSNSEPESAAPPSVHVSPLPSPKPKSLKLKLRATAASPPPHVPSSERNSLSPPPPITLKLRQSLADKAAYSSSEEDEPKKRPAKKARTSKSAPSSNGPGPQPAEAVLPAQHRKSYGWLQPSAASASHSGPAGRKRDEVQKKDETRDEPVEELLQVPKDDKPKKSHKKRTDGGPGKAWRKGIKKGVAAPLKEEGDISLPGTPPMEASSRAPSEEPAPILIDTVFEKADAQALGFPVFPKPIVPPKIALGVFPRVTASFAPANGGDTGPFPRKEKVRTWEAEEQTLVGIGGGPTSELGLVLEAERLAREAQRQAKKDKDTWERPLLTTSNSFESRDPEAKSVDDNESEIGDEETGEPKAKKRKIVKPRKSKLAQEILPTDQA